MVEDTPGGWLRAERLRLGLDEMAFCRRIFYSQVTLARAESGLRPITWARARELVEMASLSEEERAQRTRSVSLTFDDPEALRDLARILARYGRPVPPDLRALWSNPADLPHTETGRDPFGYVEDLAEWSATWAHAARENRRGPHT